MAFDAHKNFANSQVVAPPSPALSGTSLSVASGDGAKFPTPPFNAVVCPAGLLASVGNAEVVRVTAVATDTFTITRAQESSNARAIIAGDQFYAGPTAKSLTDIEAAAGGAGLPSNFVSKTTTYTALINDFVLADGTSSVFTVTLPAAPAVGALVGVKKVDGSANIITVAPAGGGTIDGGANATITSPQFGAVFEHTGSNAWKIVSVTASGGSNGIDGKTVRSGSGAPAGGLGTDGDFYIDTAASNIYGPKTAGAWGSATSLKGTNGAIAQIQNQGSNLTVRPTLDFVGSAVTASDDAGNSRTLVTVSAPAAVPRGRPVASGTTYLTVPGANPVAVNTQTQSPGRIVYEPIFVTTDISIDQLGVVVAGGAASSFGRLAIYTADVNWQPLALVIEPTTGTQLDLSTTGTKTTACVQTLTAGRYVFASNVSTGNPVYGVALCGHEWSGMTQAAGAVNLSISWYVTSAYAAFPSTPVAWTTVSTGNTGFQHAVLARVSTP